MLKHLHFLITVQKKRYITLEMRTLDAIQGRTLRLKLTSPDNVVP